ncbi:MAG: hypothetical protein KIS94_00740 [Chitinophagales bacterium]|nr:hypothetical protein [Chitinophagales bacterium]
MKPRIKWQPLVKKAVLLLITLVVLNQLWQPFRGFSDFYITTLYYLLAVAALVYIARHLSKKMQGVVVAIIAVLVSLYLAEVYLRFIYKYPLTYSERQGGEYRTMYNSPHNKIEHSDKRANPSKTYHTNVMEPFHLRNYNTTEFNYTNEHFNSLGLRGELPPRGKKVICAMGDSFTESFGAPADSTWPKLLGNMLQTIDTNLAVLNAGISGSDPFFEFKLLQQLQQQYLVTEAIFMVNCSDLLDVMTKGGNERFLENGDLLFCKAPWWEPLYAISHVFRLAMHNLGGYNYNLLTYAQQQLHEQKALQTLQTLFKTNIVPWAMQHHIKVHIVLQPMISSVINEDPTYQLMQQTFSAIEGVNYVDL